MGPEYFLLLSYRCLVISKYTDMSQNCCDSSGPCGGRAGSAQAEGTCVKYRAGRDTDSRPEAVSTTGTLGGGEGAGRT